MLRILPVSYTHLTPKNERKSDIFCALPKRQGMPRGALLFHDDLLGVLLADGGVNAGDDLVRRCV